MLLRRMATLAVGIPIFIVWTVVLQQSIQLSQLTGFNFYLLSFILANALAFKTIPDSLYL